MNKTTEREQDEFSYIPRHDSQRYCHYVTQRVLPQIHTHMLQYNDQFGDFIHLPGFDRFHPARF
jgi:hypothetical protein